MREEIQYLHSDVLSNHNINLYMECVHKHNLTSSLKLMRFEDKDSQEELKRGFFATKDVKGVERKFFIKESDRTEMPFKVTLPEEWRLKTSGGYDVVIIPKSIKPFRIKPEKMYEPVELLDMLSQFQNANPGHYRLLNILAIVSFCAKTFMCISGNPECGKSSVFETINSITDKSPVFKPRSIPGVLHQLNETGNVVFDEVPTDTKVKNIVEEINFFIAGGKPNYINGALKSKGLKQKYNCINQSITYLYNHLEHYKDREKFFDYCFEDNPAMDSRFLKLKVDGKVLEDFRKDFNLSEVAETNKMVYINIAKTLLWLSEIIKTNDYTRRYEYVGVLGLRGRRKQSYDLITLFMDMVSQDNTEYENYIKELDQCILDYRTMVNQGTENEVTEISEEFVK